MAITSIISKSKNFITVKCANATDAEEMQRRCRTKYQDRLIIEKVKEQKPRNKIKNIPIDLQSADVKLSLQEQNVWLRNADFNIAERYNVPIENPRYSNIIVECGIPLQLKFLEKGTVICNFDEKKCYESTNVMQCTKCFRFGHFARTCNELQSTCSVCAGDHAESQCASEDTRPKCINCIRSNEKFGTALNINHRPTDDRCNCRKDKINATKNVMSKISAVVS